MDTLTSTYQINKIAFREINLLKDIILDYLDQQTTIQPFYKHFPSLDNFEKILQEQSFSSEKRKVLTQALTKQYSHLDLHERVKDSIDKLALDNTFTVTTGHQLSLFGGPLFFIYKIVSTIKATQLLQAKYPAYNFVPIFWMASEDHDFEEIATFHLFGKAYTWQSTQTGAVGRMHLEGIEEIIEALPEKLPLFEQAYLQQANLTNATRYLVNHLFEQYGLICLDGDDPALKRLFVPIMKEELTDQPTSRLVQEQIDALIEQSYDIQANPREINLFYLDEGIRERLVEEDNTYKVLNTPLSFNEEDILHLLEQSPEKFSPNALLRPVYQEAILPNLAYIGGAGELAYWFELQSTFDHFKKYDADIMFPALMLRNMALILNNPNQSKFTKLGLTPEELFLDEVQLRKQWIAKNAAHQLDLSTNKEQLVKVFEQIEQKALAVDQSMGKAVGAEAQKALKIVENLEKRLVKAEERNQETSINQLLNLKDKLFPNGTLQERYDSFLNFYINDDTWIEKVMAAFMPFDFCMYVLSEPI